MGKRGILGMFGGALAGGAVGGPPGAIIGGLVGGLVGKKTEPRYVPVREHERRIGGCFIATACYGINSDEIRILREWRDKKLLRNSIGREFVNIYYKISPHIASFISNKPPLKKIVTVCINPLIKFVE